jgi:hypothetical protein
MMQATRSGWRAGTAVLIIAASCDSGGTSGNAVAVARLSRMAPVLLQAGEPWAATMLEPGQPPLLSVSAGALPTGLALDGAGRVEGVPLEAGALGAFTLACDDENGQRLDAASYELAVGSGSTAASGGPGVTAEEDAAAMSHRWAAVPDRLFVWDAALRWAWPLAPGLVLEARVLASPSGVLTLHAAGPGGAVRYDLAGAVADGEAAVFIRSVWEGEGDLDLRLVAADGPELAAGRPAWTTADGWTARHAVASERSPGGEGLVLSDRIAAGRYALVVLKAAGAEARFAVRTSARLRDGTVLQEHHSRALLSDVATGTLAGERQSGRQSWSPLGVIERDGNGAWRVHPPGHDGDPFAVDGAE